MSLIRDLLRGGGCLFVCQVLSVEFFSFFSLRGDPSVAVTICGKFNLHNIKERRLTDHCISKTRTLLFCIILFISTNVLNPTHYPHQIINIKQKMSRRSCSLVFSCDQKHVFGLLVAICCSYPVHSHACNPFLTHHIFVSTSSFFYSFWQSALQLLLPPSLYCLAAFLSFLPASCD